MSIDVVDVERCAKVASVSYRRLLEFCHHRTVLDVKPQIQYLEYEEMYSLESVEKRGGSPLRKPLYPSV